MKADGLSFHRRVARYKIDGAKNRPIVVDSRRNRAKSEPRKFPFEIISEKF